MSSLRNLRRTGILSSKILCVLAGLLVRPCLAQEEQQQAGAGQTEQVGSTRVRSFTAGLTAQTAYRDDAQLTADSGNDETVRLSMNMAWNFMGATNSIFASLTPYYEHFFSNTDLSTYGGSAGLGFRQNVSPDFAWGITGSITASPEQDLKRPQTSPDPQNPQSRRFVPRNGFLSASLGVEGNWSLSSASSFSASLQASTANFDVWDVSGTGSDSGLTDQRDLRLRTGYSRATSSRHSWSVGGSAGDSKLDQGDSASTTGSENRRLYEVTYLSNFNLGSTQSLFVGTGVSQIEDENGNNRSGTLTGGWSRAGKKVDTNVNLSRNQGFFPGTDAAVDYTSVAARMQWSQRRASFSLQGGVDFSSQTSSELETNSYNVTAGYTQSAGRLAWSINAARIEQSADQGLGESLESTTVSFSLNWTIKGARP